MQLILCHIFSLQKKLLLSIILKKLSFIRNLSSVDDQRRPYLCRWHSIMAELNECQRTSSCPKPAEANNNECGTAIVVKPTALGSPTASEIKRRRRRRLMSNTSSVVSAAAAGIPSADKHKISLVSPVLTVPVHTQVHVITVYLGTIFN